MKVFRRQSNNIIIYNIQRFLFSNSVKLQGGYICKKIHVYTHTYTYIHTYTQSILITHVFHICKFTYSLKFICSPKPILGAIFQSFTKMCKVTKILNCTHFQLGVKQSNALPSCFSSHIANKYPSMI